MSDTTTTSPLAAALAAAQAELTDPARGKAGQVKGRRDYRYAGLDDLLQTVRPVLGRHGIAIVQPIVEREGSTYLVTQLRHGSGEVLESSWRLAWSGTPQDRGSEITYARRYSLEGLVGVAPTDGDDDAARVSRPTDNGPRQDARDEAPQASTAAEVWDVERWTNALALAGAHVTWDEVRWYALRVHATRQDPLTLHPDDQRAACGWYCSEEGRTAVRSAVGEVRDEFRRKFFAKWEVYLPTPRKKDGADDAAIARATAHAEDCRRRVMAGWYAGVQSVKDLSLRAMLQGPRALPWLRQVSQMEFEAAADEVLGSDIGEDGDDGSGPDDERRWGAA